MNEFHLCDNNSVSRTHILYLSFLLIAWKSDKEGKSAKGNSVPFPLIEQMVAVISPEARVSTPFTVSRLLTGGRDSTTGEDSQ